MKLEKLFLLTAGWWGAGREGRKKEKGGYEDYVT